MRADLVYIRVCSSRKQSLDKDTLNIQIGITPFLYKTSTQFLASVVRFSGSGNSNMLSKIFREPRELPWQPNLVKIRQNWTDFSFVQDMETILAYMVGFFRVGEFTYATENLRCYGNHIWAKISQNCTDFSSVQDTETMLTCMVGFSGSDNSNMLSKILREIRELPWQPNLNKNKPKFHRF